MTTTKIRASAQPSLGLMATEHTDHAIGAPLASYQAHQDAFEGAAPAGPAASAEQPSFHSAVVAEEPYTGDDPGMGRWTTSSARVALLLALSLVGCSGESSHAHHSATTHLYATDFEPFAPPF